MIRIVPTLFWSRDLEHDPPRVRLEDIVPKSGQTRTVYVAAQAQVPDGGTVRLLWMPPISEMNGWDAQPSEIAASRVVTGRVRRIREVGPSVAGSSRVEQITAGGIEFEVSVIDCVALLSACADARPAGKEWEFPTVRTFAAGSHRDENIWELARGCDTAEVGGFIFLSANPQEMYLGLILRREGNLLVAYFHEYSWLGGDECLLGRKALSGTDLMLLERRLREATSRHDMFNYLD